MDHIHLHTEVGGPSWCVDAPPHDVVVLAGDVASSPAAAVQWAAATFDKPVVYVAGTREFHDRNRLEALAEGRKAAKAHPGVSFLENDSVEICGTTFVGATLWSDFRLFGSEMEDFVSRQVERIVIDYHRIPSSGRGGVFAAAEAKRIHAASRAWIGAAARRISGPLVVVTHHAPHPLSVHRRWIGDESVAAWVSDMAPDIESFGADLWIHGGVHDSFDYRVDRTRIVCNPKGYPRMLFGGCENARFDPALVVEVGGSTVADAGESVAA